MVFAVVKKDGAGKRRPKQNATENTRKKEKAQNSKYADERRTTGRFAKRFSGERPVSLGFELTFLSEFKRVVWRVLDRDAKRRACIVKHPSKCHYVTSQEHFIYREYSRFYFIMVTFTSILQVSQYF